MRHHPIRQDTCPPHAAICRSSQQRRHRRNASNQPHLHGGPAGAEATFEFRAAFNATATRMMTAVLKNQQAASEYA